MKLKGMSDRAIERDEDRLRKERGRWMDRGWEGRDGERRSRRFHQYGTDGPMDGLAGSTDVV